MTSLPASSPTSSEGRHDLVGWLIALPLSLAGTAMIFLLAAASLVV